MTHLKAPLERFKVQREEDFLQDAYEISLKEVIKVTMVTLELLLIHHREGFGLPFLQYIDTSREMCWIKRSQSSCAMVNQHSFFCASVLHALDACLMHCARAQIRNKEVQF